LRRRKSIFHAMLRLKCLSALASIKCQIAIFGKLTAATIDAANSLWEYRHVPMANLSYTTARAGGRMARG
jgi:hypothetical protein